MSPLKQSFHFADKTVEKFTCSLPGSSASVFTSQWGVRSSFNPKPSVLFTQESLGKYKVTGGDGEEVRS